MGSDRLVDEHVDLADAVERFLDALGVRESGYMPDMLDGLAASVIAAGDQGLMAAVEDQIDAGRPALIAPPVVK